MLKPKLGLSAGRKHLYLFCIFTFVLLTLFYYPWLTGSACFYLRDDTLFFEPLCTYLGTALREGRLPCWNHLAYCGMPQIGVSSPSVFYPFNWLFAFLPFSQGLALNMLLHQGIAGAGGFLLVASFGWGRWAAWVSGLILAFSGYMFSLENNYTLVASAAWLPVTLFAFNRLAAVSVQSQTKLKGLWTVMTSFSIYLLVTAGRPEITGVGILILAGVSLVTLWKILRSNQLRSTQIDLRSILLPARALSIGIILGMPAVLPVLEWLSLSRRSLGLAENEVFLFSGNWYDLLCLIAPQPLGDLSLRLAKYLPVVADPRMAPYVASGLVGPIAISLALIGVSDHRWQKRLLVSALLVLSLLISLGNNTPVGPFLFSVFPFLGFIRFPTKFLFFVDWCTAILAARGIYACSRYSYSLNYYPALIFWIVFCSSASIALACPGLGWQVLKDQSVNKPLLTQTLVAQAQTIIGVNGVVVSCFGIGTLIIALLITKKKLQKNFAAAIIIGLLAASLIIPALIFSRHATNRYYFDQPSFVKKAIEKLEKLDKTSTTVSSSNFPVWSQHRILGLYLEQFTCPPWLLPNDTKAATAIWYQYARQMLSPNTNMDFRIPSAFGYEAAMSGDYYNTFVNAYFLSGQANVFNKNCNASSHSCSDMPLARFCQVTATKYAITQVFKSFKSNLPALPVPMLDPKYFQLKLEDKMMNLRLYRMVAPLPRIYMSYSWKWISASHKTWDDMFSVPAFGFDPTQATFLTNKEDTSRAGKLNVSSPSSGNAVQPFFVVRAFEDNSEELLINIYTSKPGCLVLADRMYPGWEATVDGVPTTVYTANGFMRSVFIPDGTHQIKFVYRPKSLQISFFLAGIALIWLMFVLMMMSNRRP